MRFSKLFMAASAAVLLAACQPAADTKPDAKLDASTENSAETKTTISQVVKAALVDVPHAQLPDTVSPRAYRVDMMIDPQEEGMSGTVAIDVTMNEASDHIWLHAKEMTVRSARIEYKDGPKADLRFNAIPLDEAPSGIAFLSCLLYTSPSPRD